MLKRLLFVAWLALPSSAAFADNPNPSFYLVNRSNQPINQVYVSPAASTGWGRDQLGDNTIEPGANVPIRLHADGNCIFDLRIVFEDGRSEERRGVNTCNVDNIAFGQVGRAGTPSVPASPQAHDPSFRVINNAHREINEIYVRAAGTSNWGSDRLGDDTIDADSTKVIRLPPGQCFWDVRFILEGGRSLEKRRLNLCELTDLPVP